MHPLDTLRLWLNIFYAWIVIALIVGLVHAIPPQEHPWSGIICLVLTGILLVLVFKNERIIRRALGEPPRGEPPQDQH